MACISFSENDCEKVLNGGVSSDNLEKILLLNGYGWSLDERHKTACFKYLNSIKESCDAYDDRNNLEECNQVCGT